MDGFFHFTVKVTLIFPLLLSGRDFIGINLPLTLIVAACRSAEVIFSNAGWSPVTHLSLKSGRSPRCFKESELFHPFLEISTHDLSLLGAVSQRDGDKPVFAFYSSNFN